MRPRRFRSLAHRAGVLATAFAAAVVFSACARLSDISGPTTIGGTVASVSLSSTQATVGVGSTLSLQVTARDGEGRVVSDRPVMWSSSDTLIARVSSAGVVTSMATGVAQIAASVAGRSASLQLTVIPRPVASVDLSPIAPRVLVGGVVQLSAAPRDETGALLSGRAVFWSSSDPTVASVDATGFVTGLAAGVATITASSEGREAAVGLVVSPVPVASVQLTPSLDTIVVGQSTQFSAVPRDSVGTPLVERAITWTSSNSSVATVSATGLVLAIGPGSATLRAATEGASGSAAIVVAARPVGSVIVSPAQAALTIGETVALSVQVTDNGGNLLVGRPLAFSSDNTSVAQVSAEGVVRGTGIGSASITVRSEGRSGAMRLTVAPTPVATVRIQPATTTLTMGDSVRLAAVALDAAGNVLAQRDVAWTSGAPSVFTVSSSGLVRTVGAGSGVVFAVVDGRLASATVTVRQAPVASVTLTPALALLTEGSVLDLSVMVRAGDNTVITDRTVLWSSSNEAVAVVSATGRVRARLAGTARIDAVVDGVVGSITVTVQPKAVASVSVQLAATSLIVGQTTSATATLRDADGAELTGRTVAWSSSNQAVATVSSAGVITAIADGTATISGSSGGITGSAVVTVSPVPVARLTVRLGSPTRVVGQFTQAHVATYDANDNELTGRTVVWSSSKEAVATINASGRVDAVGEGVTTITATSEGVSASAEFTVTRIPVATVTVALVSSSVIVGGSTKATATLVGAQNEPLTGRTVVWTSSNTAIATVNAAGEVIPKAVGTTNIVATSEGVSGSRTLTVLKVPVASVDVTVADASVILGDSTRAAAVPRAANGDALTGRTVSWTSSNNAVATVSADGVVRSRAVGSATITATSEGISGSRPFTVVPVPVAEVQVALAKTSMTLGDSTTATATPLSAAGDPLAGRAVTWSSSNTSVATVTSTGRVRTVGLGSASIRATVEGVVGAQSITVTQVPVVSVSVALALTSLPIDGRTTATATPRDANGVALTGRVVGWSSTNTTVATVSSTGEVTARAGGTANISATVEGVSGFQTLTVQPAPVASVDVQFVATTLLVGETTTAQAVLRDGKNNVLTGRPVTWTSLNPGVATVSSSGAITAISAGTADIRATSEGVSGVGTVTVSNVPVAMVVVELLERTLDVGGTTTTRVILRDANSRELSGRTVVWSSSNQSVATVSSTGLVTAVGTGSADIIATSEGVSGSDRVVVNPASVVAVEVSLASSSGVVGQTTSASARLLDRNGKELSGRTIVWSSSNEAVATVSASGLVTTHSAGSAIITATVDGVSGSATVTVSGAPVSQVLVALAEETRTAGDTTRASVVLRDASDNVLAGRVVTWFSSNTAVATVSSTGLVTTIGAGTANIRATSEGVSGFATLTVLAAPVASVSVSLANSARRVGETTTATATTSDASGTVLTGRAITWSSTNTSVATVDANGLVTTLGVGAANISATSEGISGFAALTVSAPAPAPVASVSVVLANPARTVGQTTTATATLRDAGNNVLTGRTITWSSTNTAVATVDANGLVTTLSAGTANITATSEGISGFAALTVTAPAPAPVATVSVVLANSARIVGETTTATATLRDASNNVLTGRTITWSSTNTAVATVDANGLVTTLSAGTANIRATSEGISGFAALTVSAPAPAPVANVSVVLANSARIVGETTTATATLRDASNNVLTGRTITWSSTNTAVATVDANGLVTTLSAGTANISATSEGISGFAALTVSAPAPEPVAAVSVVLANPARIIGETTTGTATLRDAGNTVLTGRTVTWSSSNTAVATVDANGLVTTLSAGTANISATSEGISGFAALTVSAPAPAPVATVGVVLANPTRIVGQTTTATATTRDSAGAVLTGRVVTWSSTNTAVATVDANGLVTTLSAGTANISATSEGISGFAALTVSAPAPAPVASVSVVLANPTRNIGQATTATATTRDSTGAVLTGRTTTWASSNTAVATVDANGLVTTLSAGTANILATSEGISGFAQLTVTTPPPTPVDKVEVNLREKNLEVGDTLTATVVLRAANNQVLTGRTVVWSSSDDSKATVSQAGLVTGRRNGSVDIIATSEGVSGSDKLDVKGPKIVAIQVSLTSSSGEVGQTTTATARLFDANGNELFDRAITWSSSNTAVATIDANGLVTTLSAGISNITATSEGVSGFAPLSISAPAPTPVATITLALADSTLVEGDSLQISATLRDSAGATLTGRSIAWATTDSTVAIVTSTGRLHAVAAGTAVIRATSEGISQTVSVTVNPPASPATSEGTTNGAVVTVRDP